MRHFGAANFQVSMSGIEDLNIEYAGSASTGIFFDQAFGCWVKSVRSIRCPNYHFDSIDSPRTGNDGFSSTRPPNPPINPDDDQSRDLNVVATTFRHYNFDFYNNAIINHAGSRMAMPASLYLTSKPSWLRNLPWPLIGPDVSTVDCSTDSSRTNITNAARERYYGRTGYLNVPALAPPSGDARLPTDY